jgi:hypothetical protein
LNNGVVCTHRGDNVTRRRQASREDRTWGGWRWAYFLLGVASGAGGVWMHFHLTPANRWTALIAFGFCAVLCAFTLTASDSALDRFVHTDDGF